jgi:hypothetical protein
MIQIWNYNSVVTGMFFLVRSIFFLTTTLVPCRWCGYTPVGPISGGSSDGAPKRIRREEIEVSPCDKSKGSVLTDVAMNLVPRALVPEDLADVARLVLRLTVELLPDDPTEDEIRDTVAVASQHWRNRFVGYRALEQIATNPRSLPRQAAAARESRTLTSS